MCTRICTHTHTLYPSKPRSISIALRIRTESVTKPQKPSRVCSCHVSSVLSHHFPISAASLNLLSRLLGITSRSLPGPTFRHCPAPSGLAVKVTSSEEPSLRPGRFRSRIRPSHLALPQTTGETWVFGSRKRGASGVCPIPPAVSGQKTECQGRSSL